MKLLFSIFLFSLITIASLSASEQQRKAAVTSYTKSTPQVFGVFVKGLICESCGIGIKKKVTNLPFVDTSKLDKGVKVDVSKQLLLIAAKPKTKVQYATISQAIKQAGYTPVSFYVTKNGKITSFSAK